MKEMRQPFRLLRKTLLQLRKTAKSNLFGLRRKMMAVRLSQGIKFDLHRYILLRLLLNPQTHFGYTKTLLPAQLRPMKVGR